MKTSFVEKLHHHAPAIGTLITLESSASAELLSNCGFDWLFVDVEHSPLTASSTQHIVQVIQENCSAIVRVPENSATWIKKALDTGCDGIIVPLVNTAEEARRAVALAKFPPLGARSMGIVRAHDYGMSFAEYVKSANSKQALIIQIEHIDAVNNLDEILAVSGIDGVLIGPFDLSGSMNMLGNVTSKPVQDAIHKIKKKCVEKLIPVGMFVMKPEAAQKEIDEGCKFIAVGTDCTMLWGAAKEALSIVRNTKP